MKILKCFALLLLGLFLLFSILPYLIPSQNLSGERRDLFYPNSEVSEIDGVKLHFREWNSNGEKNILLVHGLGGSTFSWRYTTPALQGDGYRVIAVDLPGFGLSERRAGLDHSAEARAELLWSFLEEVKQQEQWHLVGHSMGGSVVSAMALQKPDQVESLTLAAGALVQFEKSLVASLLKYPPANRWIKVAGSRLLLSEHRVALFLASAYGREPLQEEIRGYYLPLTLEGTDAVLADLFNFEPVSLLDRVENLGMPVLCLWGEDDAWVPLAQGRELARLIPGSELQVITGEGHCPMETAPDRFNDILMQFLSESDGQ